MSAAWLFLYAAPAAAQVPFEGCLDHQLRPVAGVVSDTGLYPAWATVRADGTPVIYWNPRQFNRLSDASRLFVYLHECGHIALRHVYHWRLPQTIETRQQEENEADCWAIQMLAEGAGGSGRTLNALARDWRHSRGDATHLGGEQFLRHLQECLDARIDRRRWDAALDHLLTASRDSFATITGEVIEEVPDETLRESTLDLPGTFDCEIRRTGAFVCLIFAATKAKPVEHRFEAIAKILRAWMPSGWVGRERSQPEADQPRQFLAQDAASGVNLELVMTSANRLYFIFRYAL